jgi:Ribonuclease G/E
MTPRILGACSPGEVRIAVLADDELLDYALWRIGKPDGVGDLHRGRVTRRVPALAGSFVALGGIDGFLPDNEGGIGLREGDFVSVRVTRAARGGKGPRLTGHLMPNEIPPARGPGALLELARHYPTAAVLVDDAALAARLRPALGDRVGVVDRAFDDSIGEQVEALALNDVELPNGVRLHIHPTPALVAIDVDAGRAVASQEGKSALHLRANLAAVPALTRQIRLRNLSGAILVDFAGLPARRRSALAPALHAALAEDPLRPRLLGFTALGLAEIVRRCVHPPLHELLAGAHAAGLAALRQIVTEVAARPDAVPALHALPAVVAALRDDAEALSDLARCTGRSLILRSDPNLGTAWTIETSDASK